MTDAITTPVKLVLWDLDGTVWDETLADEPGDTRLVVLPRIAETMRGLDSVGVLQSIVSRNDAERALEQLAYNSGLDKLFLYPQIYLDDTPKSVWVQQIAQKLNIGLPDVVVVDDQRYERDQISFELPMVQTIDVDDLGTVLNGPRFRFSRLTDEDRNRRHMYLADAQRQEAQRDYEAQPEHDLDAYLRSERLRLVIRKARHDDLWRASTLTVRTHQLNATGKPYSHDELDALRDDPNHLLLIASLTDRHGDYGTIGLALINVVPRRFHLKLLLTSCRVMSRRVGTIMLGEIMRIAHEGAGMTEMYADFVDIEHGRNRAMMAAYAMAGFTRHHLDADVHVLRAGLTSIRETPDWMDVTWLL